MKHLLAVANIIVILCLMAACDRAPSGVIPESKMEDLIVDLELADAYIESHWDQFPDDSSRLVLKQSIFAKYDVTPELYDTSLVWYARNMEVYVQVYDNVIKRLKTMSDNASNETSSMPAAGMGAGYSAVNRSFEAHGDSADIWRGPRRWMLTGNMAKGFITFDVDPDKEYKPGDRYELQFKLKRVRSGFKTFLAVDYNDGSTTIVNRYSCGDGWNTLPLQSDSARVVRRIYGFVNYNITKGDIAYVDSMLILRTHLNRSIYNHSTGQRLIERVKRSDADAKSAPQESAHAPAQSNNVPTVSPQAKQPQGSYKPKEGVNKSSASRHVTQSPNERHLPNKN